jgi:hypothetical protein
MKPASMTEQQDLTEKMAQGHEAELMSKMMEDEFVKRKQEIEKEIFQLLEAPGSTLSGEKAIQSWIELHAIHRLERHLRRRIQLGESASKRVREGLAGPDEEPSEPTKRRFSHT